MDGQNKNSGKSGSFGMLKGMGISIAGGTAIGADKKHWNADADRAVGQDVPCAGPQQVSGQRGRSEQKTAALREAQDFAAAQQHRRD